MTDAIKTYVLRQWLRGELNASDALDRIREAGGHVTSSEYWAMRQVDALGRLPNDLQ